MRHTKFLSVMNNYRRNCFLTCVIRKGLMNYLFWIIPDYWTYHRDYSLLHN